MSETMQYIREALHEIADPQWRTNRGHEYETTTAAFAAGRNEIIDRVRALVAYLDKVAAGAEEPPTAS